MAENTPSSVEAQEKVAEEPKAFPKEAEQIGDAFTKEAEKLAQNP